MVCLFLQMQSISLELGIPFPTVQQVVYSLRNRMQAMRTRMGLPRLPPLPGVTRSDMHIYVTEAGTRVRLGGLRALGALGSGASCCSREIPVMRKKRVSKKRRLPEEDESTAESTDNDLEEEAAGGPGAEGRGVASRKGGRQKRGSLASGKEAGPVPVGKRGRGKRKVITEADGPQDPRSAHLTEAREQRRRHKRSRHGHEHSGDDGDGMDMEFVPENAREAAWAGTALPEELKAQRK